MVSGTVLKHGKGRYSDAHFTYEGEWQTDRMHGNGVYVGATGDRYEGGFQANVYQGMGKYTFSDGSVYMGQWLSNRMHGEGEYISHDGIRWAGTFFNGLYCDGKAHVALRPIGAVR